MIYESFQLIGEGETSKVYRAFDRLMNRSVAVKRLKAEKLRADAIESVLEQTRALRGLVHPNLAVIYDVYRHEDAFIVTELFEGENLEALSRHGKMLFEQFVPFALQIQEGVIAAHSQEILHGGIKPSNILLQWLPSGSMHVKIVDFGLSRLSRADETSIDGARFMSPEQLERQPLDARSDLYSLGCLYYFCLTQRHPFEGENFQGVIDSHLRHDVVPLQEARPDLPQWLCDWVMRHIERQPANRPENVMAAFQSFRQQASHQTAEPAFKRTAQPMVANERHRIERTKSLPHPIVPPEKRRISSSHLPSHASSWSAVDFGSR